MNETETTQLREIFKLMKKIQLCVSKCGVCPKYGIETETKTEWAERIEM